MNVEHTRADLEVTVAKELVELVDVAVVLRPAELDRGHVDPRVGPQWHDLAEIPIAHVRVHLDVDRLVENPIQRRPHAPRVDCTQLRRLLGRQRPSFTDRGLVDLNDSRADINQVTNLLGDWSGHGPKEQVVRYVRRAEAPVHDRDRAGEHSLDRLARCGLGNLPLAHRDRFCNRGRSVEDWRSGATAAVRKHPSCPSREETVHPLGEVLDHVGALEFAMDEDVHSFRVLPSDRVADEPIDTRPVRTLIDLPAR